MAYRLRQSSKRRFVPYDLSVPGNWTVAKLKTEISKLGVTLSAYSISKSALLQIHQQLEAVQNIHGGIQLNYPTSSTSRSISQLSFQIFEAMQVHLSAGSKSAGILFSGMCYARQHVLCQAAIIILCTACTGLKGFQSY